MRARHLQRRITWRNSAWGLVSLVALATWFFLLRPVVLGGPVTYSIVSGHSMEPTFEPGDYVIARTETGYAKGDIVMFEVPGGVIVHRIVGGSADGFITQGDGNPGTDPWRPSEKEVLGKAWVRVPKLGIAIGAIRGPLGIGLMAWVLTSMILLKVMKPGGRHAAAAQRSGHVPASVHTAGQRPMTSPRDGTMAGVGHDPWAYLNLRPRHL